jgi:signal transduction histidine kinase
MQDTNASATRISPPVLVVDNDNGNLLALESILQTLDCRVVVANSGREAIRKTHEEDFAAILMDVCMPALDGYATGSFIRQSPRSAHTPILFISGQDHVDVVRLTRLYGNSGQVDAIQKPIEPAALRSKVATWLSLFRTNQQVHELEKAVASITEQARRRDDAIGVVAHDLRGPLSALGLQAARLAAIGEGATGDPVLAAAVARHCQIVDRTVSAMTRMVNDLLESTHLDSGALQLQCTSHRADEIIAQALELLRPLAEEKGLGLQLQGPPETCTIWCDRDRVLQVLSNLLGNAVKFTAPGGRVRVDAETYGDELVVCVEDTGPGIPDGELPFVFEKYWQGQQENGRKGIGLGLAIAKTIVLAHDGRIWVDSDLGKGSRFLFSIPLRRGEDRKMVRSET